MITTIILMVAATALAGPAQAPAPAVAAPVAVFTTWVDDPTTSVSVDWHLEPGTDVAALEMRPLGTTSWTRIDGTSIRFPHSRRTVRRANVRNLVPATTYELRIGDSRTWRYRTMPATMTRPIRFAAGGDTQADELRFGPMNRIAAARDVDFVMFGGDLAYSNGDPRLVSREEAWFETLTKTLVTADGRLIPVIAAIGNHEVFSNRDTTEATRALMRATGVTLGSATYFDALHAYAKAPHYGVLDIGNYLSIVLLNTNHTAPVAGAQTAWLDSVLTARAHVPHVFPIYHVPAYPSVRAFVGSTSAQVREHWVPRFERHGIRVAFENHDHAYKRTVPLKAGVSDPGGIVYMGDGAWGAGPRELGRDHEQPAPYVAAARSAIHGIFITLEGRRAQFDVVDSAGVRFDDYSTAEAGGVVEERFITTIDSLHNIDGAAVWHGPLGQHWLLATAKDTDVILVHDAATGAPLRQVGGRGDRPGMLRRPNGITVIGDIVLVVERDNHRVQAFGLPQFTPLGTFGDSVLRRPYGIAWHPENAGTYVVHVTDNHAGPDASPATRHHFGERVKQFRVSMTSEGISARQLRSFGDTTGPGVLRVVESIAVDAAYGRVLVAEEAETDSHLKVYDLEGKFTGRIVGRGLFPQQAEGLALYPCGDRGGYWIVTDQGDATNSWHLLDRATLEHVASFRGASTRRTDGIAVTRVPFGRFAAGALYASHLDGAVSALSWEDIARATGVRSGCSATEG